MPSPEQRRKLRDALIDAFPDKSSLEQMLYFGLNKNLNEITRDGSLEVIVFELIKRAISEGWFLDLVRAAWDERPRNINLQAIAQELLGDHSEPADKSNFQANNLPIQLSSFIGRKLEIEEVKQLLTTTRLLTLTGAGGCGKTRLGLQVAADLQEKYADGVWLVELAALSEPTLIPQQIASVLGVREESRQSLIYTLIEFLKPKSLLLILDNSEHLIVDCAHLVTTLLRYCPTLQILVTSRESLGIAGETIWRVPSLNVANPNQIPPLESLIEFDAIHLFIERAINVKQDFKVTNRNALSIVLICYQLDGIPLAIELAAKRVNIFSVEEILRRLPQMFRLLTGGSRTVMPRQQTLYATIDWSYNLLPKPEKILFRRLSVFAGGWTLKAVETMCIGEEIVDNNNTLANLRGLNSCRSIVNTTKRGKLGKNLG